VDVKSELETRWSARADAENTYEKFINNIFPVPQDMRKNENDTSET